MFFVVKRLQEGVKCLVQILFQGAVVGTSKYDKYDLTRWLGGQ